MVKTGAIINTLNVPSLNWPPRSQCLESPVLQFALSKMPHCFTLLKGGARQGGLHQYRLKMCCHESSYMKSALQLSHCKQLASIQKCISRICTLGQVLIFAENCQACKFCPICFEHLVSVGSKKRNREVKTKTESHEEGRFQQKMGLAYKIWITLQGYIHVFSVLRGC